MSLIINPYRYAVPSPPVGSLHDEIMSDSPVYYFRHAEASGLVMENEVGSDGVYTSGGVTLGSAALYPGGPTSVRIPGFSGSGRGELTTGTAPDMNEITVMTIVKFNATMSGLKSLVSFDSGSNRRWQFRVAATGLDWVKIVGSVETKSFAAGFVSGATYLVAATIDNSGNIKFNINGVNVYTSTIGVVNYGGGTNFIQVGYATGAGGASANSFFSESAIFDKPLSDSRLATYWTATGL